MYLSRIWCWVDLEPRRRYTVEGQSLLERASHEHADRNVAFLGLVVGHRLHNAEVVGHYVIVNAYVPHVCIQAD